MAGFARHALGSWRAGGAHGLAQRVQEMQEIQEIQERPCGGVAADAATENGEQKTENRAPLRGGKQTVLQSGGSRRPICPIGPISPTALFSNQPIS